MKISSRVCVIVLLLLVSGSSLAADGGQIFGKGVALPDTVKVSDLMADPDAYVGKTIAVTGTAVGVCEHRGCWVNLASDQEGQTVRVKVKDGEIVFPPEILGDTVTAQGVWIANTLDLETTKKVCAHRAGEKGENFNPDSVTECMTLYQLSGTGAVAQK